MSIAGTYSFDPDLAEYFDEARSFSDAYLAGFFDGEGCLSCTIRDRGAMGMQWQAYACVHVGGCIPVLMAFQMRFGGSIRATGAHRENGHAMHTWRIQANGEKMAAFCEWVIAHCWYKKPLAEILLPVCRIGKRGWGGHGKTRVPTEVIRLRSEAFIKIIALNSGKGPEHSPHYAKFSGGSH